MRGGNLPMLNSGNPWHHRGVQLRFARLDDERVLFGAAGGFAREHSIDPWTVRLRLLVLTLAGGIGVVLYGALVVLSGGPVSTGSTGPTRADTAPPSLVAQRSIATWCVTGAILFVASLSGS